MRSALRMTVLAGILALASMQSYAAFNNPFGSSGLPLTKGDFEEMSKAVQPLLNDDSLPIGSTGEWRNPVSGNHGIVKLLQRFQVQYQGSTLPCRKLAYHIDTQKGPPYNLELDRCKVADGSWKIY